MKTGDVSKANKDAAVSFLKMVVARNIREAYAKYVDPKCRCHNPYFGDSAPELMAGMEEAHRTFPDTVIKVQRAIAEEDLVAVHSHITMKPGEPGFVTAHIFRFEQGRIVEFWDLAQPVPTDSPNKSGMF